MYSLTIHFGPNAVMWQFLFKEKEKAQMSLELCDRWADANCELARFRIVDDFGQEGFFTYEGLHGALLEDIDLMEEARIQRSLADARAQAKLQARARTDSVLRSAQAGAPVLTPMGGFSRQ